MKLKQILFTFSLITIVFPTFAVQDSKGFFDFTYSENEGFISLTIKANQIDQEFIYVNSLAAGIGSNDIGLDRGQLGGTRVVKFVKVANKILLIQPNFDYRAISSNQEEVKSVEEAFAQSVIWGFNYTSDGDDGFVIDISEFLMRDSHGVANRLAAQNQGNYSVDKSRSALYFPRTKNFPDNTEFEALITFKGKPKGGNIKSVTPTADAVTVRMHHSFVRLPDNDYEPREFDPRSGFFFSSYQDYATPIDQPLVKRFIARHRLKKKNPNEAISEPVEPIIYYLDRGAPEPVKSALIEGASWWNQAFEAAGFKNAFQVKVLPEGADPLDVRYNVIQWVHRSTRGWSYGASVSDPRTGEIIKGHVSLGSLRVRQDFLIAEGLVGPYKDGKGTGKMLEMSLARLRQLSAHEVGHTIGLAHNYGASYNDRASVMDYPHPTITLDKNGKISLANAYATGIGEWDKEAVKFGYSESSKTERTETLNKAFERGLKYITDQDARPLGSAHPYAHLWDNGKDAADELDNLLKIRKKVLNQFSTDQIADGMPYSSIEEVLVPMYFLHRYQIEAAAKVIGGLNYSYALKGGSDLVTEWVDPKIQKKALKSLLSTLSVDHLKLSESTLKLLPPRAYGFSRTRETFKSKTGVTFDALSPAETISQMSLSLLLHPQRANRILEFNSRNDKQPALSEVIEQLIDATIKQKPSNGYEGEIQRIVAVQTLNHLMSLAASDQTHTQVKAITSYYIEKTKAYLNTQTSQTSEIGQQAHFSAMLNMISQFEKKPQSFRKQTTLSPPDGSPIGTDVASQSLYCDF